VKAGTHIFFVLKQRKNNGNKKAMPHLGLEAATPTETEKAITALEEENRELKDHITRLEDVMQKMYQKVFHEEIQQEEHEKFGGTPRNR